jgi:hypothetical protein
VSTTALLPVETRTDSGYFVAGAAPFLVQGCSVAKPHVDEEALRRATSHGLSTIRLWADYNESGKLDLDELRAIREWGEQLDFRVLIVLFSPAPLTDMYEGTSRFDRGLTMYNGMCARAADVVRDEQALAAIVERCRTILSVFEDSPVLLGWEVVNQTDDLYEVSPVVMADFARRLAEHVRRADRGYGQTRLVTASSLQPMPPEWLLRFDEIDFVGFHAYSESHHAPTDRVEAAVHVGATLKYALEGLSHTCPIVDVESGPIAHLFDVGYPRPGLDFRRELAHNIRWAHFASGGAGSGLHISINDEGLTAERVVPLSRLRWHPLASELEDMAAIDRVWSSAPGSGVVRHLGDAASSTADDVFAFASATPQRAVGWLLRDTRAADLAADLDRALAAGPTVLSTLDLRLHALDAWRAGLRRLGLDPHREFTRKAIGMLLRRGRSGVGRACELVDEGLEHLLAVTRRVAPSLLEANDPGPFPAGLRVGGLDWSSFRLTWFDDVDGAVLESTAVEGPFVQASSPPFGRHIAFVLSPEGPGDRSR